MGVKDPQYYPKRFCTGVRDPRYYPKSYVGQEKTHGHVYHLDLELSDRSWVDSGWITHWKIAIGVGEPTKARYMGVIGITSDDCHTWHRHVRGSR